MLRIFFKWIGASPYELVRRAFPNHQVQCACPEVTFGTEYARQSQATQWVIQPNAYLQQCSSGFACWKAALVFVAFEHILSPALGCS